MKEETKQQPTLARHASHSKERPVESETFLSMPLEPNANTAISSAAGAKARINAAAADVPGSFGCVGSILIKYSGHKEMFYMPT